MQRFTCTASVVALACVLASASARADLISEAVGFWSFSEGMGTTTADVSATTPNIPLSFSGSTGWQTTGGPRDGEFGNYVLVPLGSYLTTVGDQSALDMSADQAFSVAGWLRLDHDAGIVWLANKMQGGGGDLRGWGLGLRGANAPSSVNSVEFWFRHSHPNNERIYARTLTNSVPASTVEDPVWVHIAATYEPDYDAINDAYLTSGLAIYINGAHADLASSISTLAEATKSVSNDSSFNLGGRNDGGQFRGAMDEVGIWGRALSAHEVATLVPEPSTLMLLACALFGMLGFRRRFR